MNYTYSILLGLIILGLSSCSTCRYTAQPKEKTTAFEMQKTPCFGQCPVYNLFVFTDGTVLYEGLNFVEKKGLYTNVLSKKEYAQLCKTFHKARWNKLDSTYTSELPDLASTTITLYTKKGSKTVMGRDNIPEAFKQVEKVFTDIANKEKGWKPMPRGANLFNDWTPDQFIVKLTNETDLQLLIDKYNKYDLKSLKRLAPDLNYWVLGFDVDKVSSAKFFYLLRQEAVISEIQYNRGVILR